SEPLSSQRIQFRDNRVRFKGIERTYKKLLPEGLCLLETHCGIAHLEAFELRIRLYLRKPHDVDIRGKFKPSYRWTAGYKHHGKVGCQVSNNGRSGYQVPESHKLLAVIH